MICRSHPRVLTSRVIHSPVLPCLTMTRRTFHLQSSSLSRISSTLRTLQTNSSPTTSSSLVDKHFTTSMCHLGRWSHRSRRVATPFISPSLSTNHLAPGLSTLLFSHPHSSPQ